MFRKIILPGLIAGAGMFAVGMGVSAVFTAASPSSKLEYNNTLVFRSMEDPLMMLYFVHPFFLGIVLSWIWNSIKIVFLGKSIVNNIFRFAFSYWLISSPGMLISYSTFQISLMMVTNWTVAIFFESVLAAFVFVKMNP